MRSQQAWGRRDYARRPEAWDRDERERNLPSHAPSLPEQKEFVRQTAREYAAGDPAIRAELVDMLIGENVDQTAAHYADALGDPGLAGLLRDALVDEPLAEVIVLVYPDWSREAAA
jgi:hypothetical protein